MMRKKDPKQKNIGAEDNVSSLSPAQRALAEAEERRKNAAINAERLPKEVGRREGPEPTRYGDWEKGGIASDF